MIKSEELARRWMPGHRQGPGNRPAWMHPQDLVNLLAEMRAAVPDSTLFLFSPRAQVESDRYHERLRDIAWLHDIIEDGVKEDGSRVTAADLRAEGIPEVVIEDVVALSQREGEEKVDYLARLDKAEDSARLVKCIDRICNLREGAAVFKDKRWARYTDETVKYIIPLAAKVPFGYGTWLGNQLTAALATRMVAR